MANVEYKEKELHIAKERLKIAIGCYEIKLRVINNTDLFKIDPAKFTALHTAHIEVLREKVNVCEVEKQLELLKQEKGDKNEK